MQARRGGGRARLRSLRLALRRGSRLRGWAAHGRRRGRRGRRGGWFRRRSRIGAGQCGSLLGMRLGYAKPEDDRAGKREPRAASPDRPRVPEWARGSVSLSPRMKIHRPHTFPCRLDTRTPARRFQGWTVPRKATRPSRLPRSLRHPRLGLQSYELLTQAGRSSSNPRVAGSNPAGRARTAGNAPRCTG